MRSSRAKPPPSRLKRRSKSSRAARSTNQVGLGLAASFGSLSGLQEEELSGQHFGIVSLTFYRRVSNLQWLPAYLGGSIELGGAWNRWGDLSLDQSTLGGSVFLGVDSPLGPLYFALGQAEGGKSSAHLYLGKLF